MFYEKHFNWEKLANGKTTCRTFAPIQRPSYCPARESAPIRQWVKNTFFSREIRVLLPLEGEHRKKYQKSSQIKKRTEQFLKQKTSVRDTKKEMSQANLIPRPAFWKVPDYTNDNHSHRASASAATASTPLPYTSQYQQHNNHQHHNPRQYQYQHHLRQNQPTTQQSQHMVKPVTGTGLRTGVTGSSPSSSSYAPITSTFNSSTVGSPRGLLKKHRNFGKSTKRVRFRDTVDEYDYHANPVEYKYQTPNPINVSEWMTEWIYPICVWACFPHTIYFEYSARSIAIPDVIVQ